MAIQLLLWDWNGTILNDVQETVDSYNKMLYNFNKREEQLTKEEYREHFQSDIRGFYKYLGFTGEEQEFKAAAKMYLDFYKKESMKSPLQKDIPEVLDYFRTKGIQQKIVSASNQKIVTNQVRRFPLGRFIDEVIGCSTIYAENKKKLVEDTLRKAKCQPEECLMVGDTITDGKIATELGLHCCMFTGGHQNESNLPFNLPKIHDMKELLQFKI